MFKKLLGIHKDNVHWTRVAKILRFEFGIDANGLMHLTRPDLVDICAKANQQNINVETTVIVCLQAIVTAMTVDPTKIPLVGSEFMLKFPIIISWVEEGKVSEYSLSEYSDALERYQNTIGNLL